LALSVDRRAAELGISLTMVAARMGRTPGLLTHLARSYAIDGWRFELLCRALETTPEQWSQPARTRPTRAQLVRKWRRNLRRSGKSSGVRASGKAG
jgi:hypothetical protein